jgi:hypothetical protein
MRIHELCAIGAICAAASLPRAAGALTVTPDECREGADFIRNAALSRENGIRADDFLRRLEDDLVAIRSVPSALRWFARDADDEALLRVAALTVFVEPRGPEVHHREFLATCQASVAAAGGQAPRVAALPPAP